MQQSEYQLKLPSLEFGVSDVLIYRHFLGYPKSRTSTDSTATQLCIGQKRAGNSSLPNSFMVSMSLNRTNVEGQWIQWHIGFLKIKNGVCILWILFIVHLLIRIYNFRACQKGLPEVLALISSKHCWNPDSRIYTNLEILSKGNQYVTSFHFVPVLEIMN